MKLDTIEIPLSDAFWMTVGATKRPSWAWCPVCQARPMSVERHPRHPCREIRYLSVQNRSIILTARCHGCEHSISFQNIDLRSVSELAPITKFFTGSLAEAQRKAHRFWEGAREAFGSDEAWLAGRDAMIRTLSGWDVGRI